MSNREAGVLIVDDEADVCWALTHVLKRSGLRPVSVNSGEAALALKGQHPFRLIFVDAKLPDLDGIELARRLSHANSGAPVFLISGYFYRDDAEVHRALAEGIIKGFISKPFLHEEIRHIAASALA